MSAPLIWIILPAVASIIFWLMRERRGRMTLLATVFCLLFAGLALVLPIGAPVRLGPISFTVNSTLALAGRRLILDSSDRPMLVFLFFLCSFWFAGSYAAGSTNLFIPFSLGMVALLIASLAVEPFLYAALLVEMAVLLAVPMLTPPGTFLGQGVLRFLIFQTLAMPFILLAGWAMAGVEANPSSLILIQLSTAFLGLGFAFWLAVFPFYTWIPLLAEQTFPYVSGFIFFALPTVSLVLGQDFLTNFAWIRNSPGMFQVIGQVGLLMIVTAGAWAAFQNDLARVFGYAVIVEGGFSLLATSLVGVEGRQLFTSMFLPRMLSIGLWALCLSIIRSEVGSTRFEDVRGIVVKMPYACAGLAVASLTLAGLPILGMFPIRLALMENLAQVSFVNALVALAGMVGMLFSTFRVLAVLTSGWFRRQAVLENRFQIALILGGVFSLILVGLLPQVFYPLMFGLLGASPALP
jgi:NADH-quinone oxidoreductase subunit N